MHFLRDMLGHVAKPHEPMVAAAIRGIFRATGYDEARALLAEVVERLDRPAPKVARLLEGAEPDLLAFYRFTQQHWSKLRSRRRRSASRAGRGRAHKTRAAGPAS